MKTYKLLQTPFGDMLLDHSSCMYPSSFEDKINKLAGEKITTIGLPFMGLINSFCIKGDKLNIFTKKVIPNIGFKHEKDRYLIWDKEEFCPEI